jgi:hypothetical protein
MDPDAGSFNTDSESPHVVINLLESFLAQGKNDSTEIAFGVRVEGCVLVVISINRESFWSE